MLALSVAACSSETSPTGLAFEQVTALNDVPGQGNAFVRVCKVSFNDFEGLPDDGTLGTPFDFTTTATGPTVVAPKATVEATANADLTVALKCPVVWESPSQTFDDQTLVSITEEAMPGFELASVFYQYVSDGIFRGYDLRGGATVTLAPQSGLVVYFKNAATDTPPPPVGGQGCTPGYWRQPHHYDSWVGLTPDDNYMDVFGVGPDIALGDAIEMKGGKFNALTRHSVAALLSSKSPEVEYDLTATDVIAHVQAAYASGDWKDTKNQFDALNNQGCPLN